jgi:hypothetical protein
MRLPLDGTPYYGQSLIASAERAINLYAEPNKDPAAPAPITWYPIPGTVLFSEISPAFVGKNRGIYRTTSGTVYTVIGSSVFQILANGTTVFIGTITDRPTQIVFADNGLAVVLVDGTQGWAIDMATNSFGVIIDPAFYGASHVVFLDTFFVFNRPGTNQFYWSLSMVSYALLTGGTSFDPLDIAAKAGSADPLIGLATAHKELWLIGTITSEVWIGTGAADSYFQQQQGAYIDHGGIAAYSIANQDIITFFLMRDRQGRNMVLMAAGYEVFPISTPFLVSEFNSYSRVDDAIGFCFQINNHAFYALIFPTANKGWLYDITSKQWSEWAWLNTDDGSLNRPRANCATFGHDRILLGDWENGYVYYLDEDTFTDNEVPVIRRRRFKHLVGDTYERIVYRSFDAYIEVGNGTPGTDYQIDLSWSDDAGKTFSNPLSQVFQGGQYAKTLTWNGLGMARDRVFQLEWSAPVKTAINGAFIEVKPART